MEEQAKKEKWLCRNDGFIHSKMGNFFIFFIVSTIISSSILYVLNPSFIQTKGTNGKPTGDISFVKLLIPSVTIGMIFGFIGYTLKLKC